MWQFLAVLFGLYGLAEATSKVTNRGNEFLQPLIVFETSSPGDKKPIYHYHLPTKTVPDCKDISYVRKPRAAKLHLCPIVEDKIVTKISKIYWTLEFCLVVESVTDEKPDSEPCQKELTPVLVPMGRETELRQRVCGPQKMDIVLKFGYPYCGTVESLKEFVKKSAKSSFENKDDVFPPRTPFVEMYKICYDNTKKRTVYTHHRIMSPLLLADERLQNERVYECEEISTEAYHVKDQLFSKLRDMFASQKETDPDYMEPQILVPKEDMALNPWKKSVCHYINIAPLWHSLINVMELINRRIRNLAIEKIKELEIYTAAFHLTSGDHPDRYITSGFIRNKHYLVPNIWCKMIYDSVDYSGIAIIVHNTPRTPPRANELCDEKVECDFKNWPETQSLPYIIDDEQFEYVYCCKVTEKILNFYGAEGLKIQNILDLNVTKSRKKFPTNDDSNDIGWNKIKKNFL